jgi:integrase
VLPEDFESLRASMAKRWGLARRGKFIQLIRSAFKYGIDNGLVKQPILFGSTFKKPGKAVMRKHKAAGGKKLFSGAEIRLMLDALDGKELDIITKSGKRSKLQLPANPQLKAIVLIGLNGGLGNADISGLQFSHLDLDGEWVDYPRPKTGLKRRIPLWKETTAALRCHIAKRRVSKHNDDKDCVFLNRAGRRMVQEHVTNIDNETNVWSQDYVSSQFRSLLVALKINGRKGLNFYSLRHSFATIGLQTGDRDAVRALMGQAENDVLSVYDETGPSDERLTAVTAHVRDWLFNANEK